MSIKIIKNIKIWLGISSILLAISLIGVIYPGLNYGIDFTGGNLFQLKYDEEIKLEDANKVLDEVAVNVSQFNSSSRIVQISEKSVIIIRTPEVSEKDKKIALTALKKLGDYDILKIDKVGSAIGSELKWNAISALLIGILLITGYISFRFEWKYALGAIIALIHDVLIALGGIALLGNEINTPFIAAILTILGYSINDTIVVYDRIRELDRRYKDKSYEDIIDESVNSVMTRSINTSLTTFLAVFAILVFGGASLKTFITTLLIGIVCGTYSSIFVASPILYLLNNKAKKIKK